MLSLGMYINLNPLMSYIRTDIFNTVLNGRKVWAKSFGLLVFLFNDSTFKKSIMKIIKSKET